VARSENDRVNEGTPYKFEILFGPLELFFSFGPIKGSNCLAMLDKNWHFLDYFYFCKQWTGISSRPTYILW
jgi:hypothetical protein